MKKTFCIALGMLVSLLTLGCQRDVTAVWTANSGSVPASWPSPAGFTISPSRAQGIAEAHFGKKKVIQHIYADSSNYYIVNGFPGSTPSQALKAGVKVNGLTGECKRMNDTANNTSDGIRQPAGGLTNPSM